MKKNMAIINVSKNLGSCVNPIEIFYFWSIIHTAHCVLNKKYSNGKLQNCVKAIEIFCHMRYNINIIKWIVCVKEGVFMNNFNENNGYNNDNVTEGRPRENNGEKLTANNAFHNGGRFFGGDNALSVENSDNLHKSYTMVGLGLCVFFALMFISQLIMSFATMLFSPLLLEEGWVLLYLTDIPIYGVALWAFLFFISKVKAQKIEKKPFGIMNSISVFFIACFFMMTGAVIGNIIDMVLQGILGLELEDSLNATANTMSLPIQVLFFVIIAPFGEEFVFRKLILDRIAPYGEGAAILYSGLTFALFHGNFNQLFYAFAVGILLAYIYVKTGSYLRCVLLHGIVNAIFGVIAPLLFELCGDNTILQTVVSLGEWALCFIGIVVFIVFLACRKVKIEKSQYSLAKSALSCAFSNPTFIIYAVILGLTVLSNYFSAIA